MRKRICVVSGSRAEYGLFYPLLNKIRLKRRFELQIVATGMHLCRHFGLTYKEIEGDGFKISAKVRIPLSDDSVIGITKSIGIGIIKLAGAFNRLKPNIVILLGDRFEVFAAATAAFIMKIPIVHIHGGELTEGAMDDAMRHSITKMSSLHFAAAQKYRKRIIQLGESPERVFNVGALGIGNIKNLKLLTKRQLEKELKFRLENKTILVTFHPATLENNTAEFQFKELLSALDSFMDLKIIFTMPNADPDGRIISRLINDYVRKNSSKAVSFVSMGRLRYLSTMKYIDAVVGNSSSGIIEAPIFGKPTVNIGDRQKGRIRVKSIIDCKPLSRNIKLALQKAFSPKFVRLCKTVKSPYGDGMTSEKIYEILNKNIENLKSIKKTFYSIGIK